MYSLDQELAFATQKVREQRAVIATLQSNLAAAREELAVLKLKVEMLEQIECKYIEEIQGYAALLEAGYGGGE